VVRAVCGGAEGANRFVLTGQNMQSASASAATVRPDLRRAILQSAHEQYAVLLASSGSALLRLVDMPAAQLAKLDIAQMLAAHPTPPILAPPVPDVAGSSDAMTAQRAHFRAELKRLVVQAEATLPPPSAPCPEPALPTLERAWQDELHRLVAASSAARQQPATILSVASAVHKTAPVWDDTEQSGVLAVPPSSSVAVSPTAKRVSVMDEAKQVLHAQHAAAAKVEREQAQETQEREPIEQARAARPTAEQERTIRLS
jgi:hypothetical protein